jgi:hypothetical protein
VSALLDAMVKDIIKVAVKVGLNSGNGSLANKETRQLLPITRCDLVSSTASVIPCRLKF